MTVFDGVVIILVILSGIQGLQKGLITGLFNFIGTIAGFVVAASQYQRFLGWADSLWPIRAWLEPKMYNLFLPAIETRIESVEQQTISGILNLLPEALRRNFNWDSLPSFEAFTRGAAEQVAGNLAGTATELILKIGAFIVLFFATLMIVQIVGALILQPFGGKEGFLNRFGGAIFGGLSTLVFIAIVTGLLVPFLNTVNPDSALKSWIMSGTLYPHLNNLFEFLVALIGQGLQSGILDPLKDFDSLRNLEFPGLDPLKNLNPLQNLGPF